MKRLMDMTISELESLNEDRFSELDFYAEHYDVEAERSILKKTQYIGKLCVFTDGEELSVKEFTRKLNDEVVQHERIADIIIREWTVVDRVIVHDWDYDESSYELHFKMERPETDEEVLKRLRKTFKTRLTKLRKDDTKASKREENERKEFERLKRKFGES